MGQDWVALMYGHYTWECWLSAALQQVVGFKMGRGEQARSDLFSYAVLRSTASLTAIHFIPVAIVRTFL
jgi:hypothetical protein